MHTLLIEGMTVQAIPAGSCVHKVQSLCSSKQCFAAVCCKCSDYRLTPTNMMMNQLLGRKELRLTSWMFCPHLPVNLQLKKVNTPVEALGPFRKGFNALIKDECYYPEDMWPGQYFVVYLYLMVLIRYYLMTSWSQSKTAAASLLYFILLAYFFIVLLCIE